MTERAKHGVAMTGDADVARLSGKRRVLDVARSAARACRRRCLRARWSRASRTAPRAARPTRRAQAREAPAPAARSRVARQHRLRDRHFRRCGMFWVWCARTRTTAHHRPRPAPTASKPRSSHFNRTAGHGCDGRAAGKVAGPRPNLEASRVGGRDLDAHAVKHAVAIGRHVAEGVAAADLARDALARLQQLARRPRQEALAARRPRQRLQDAGILLDVVVVEDARRCRWRRSSRARARAPARASARLALSPPSLITTSAFLAREPLAQLIQSGDERVVQRRAALRRASIRSPVRAPSDRRRGETACSATASRTSSLKRSANSSSCGLLVFANASDAASTSPSFVRMLPLASTMRPIVAGASSLVKSSMGTLRPLSKTTNCSRARSETYRFCLSVTTTGSTTSSLEVLRKLGRILAAGTAGRAGRAG